MRYKVYQIVPELDEKGVKFASLKRTSDKNQSYEIDASIYKKTLDVDIDTYSLEDVYELLNTVGHPLSSGESMSISDVIVAEDGAYFCDSVGFQPIIFDESKVHQPAEAMKIVYVEPGKKPYIAEIHHTLDAMQKAVDGYIEVIYCHDDATCCVGNEEAKLIGMKGNRHYCEGRGIIAGPFFVVGLGEEDFRSLTDEEADKYMEFYKEPEEISDEEVAADSVIHVY